MTAILRLLWSKISASYWFYPALFSIVALLLALGLVNLDRSGATAWLSEAKVIVPARPQGASNMLTVIAGSMIGVASTVFSITIAAVAYASGTYGPRLLTNFMQDKGNQLSLATFIATFVYALTVLRTIRGSDEGPVIALQGDPSVPSGFVPQLSLLVAYALMAISIGVLVYFLNHIPSSIRINHVLEGIGRRLLRDIERTFPEETARQPISKEVDGNPIFVDGTGYVQMIDFSGLSEIARKADATIALAVRTGDFVHRHTPIANACMEDGSEDFPAQIAECFTLGATRTPDQDIQFLIDELVEIALRALSPGINDPFTAITAVHWLGAATSELGRRDLRMRLADESPSDCPVIPVPSDFPHFLARGFGAARSAIASSPIASLVTLDSLRDAARAVTDGNRRSLLRAEGDLLMAQAELALGGPDLEKVRQRHAEFHAALLG
ncbi:hypothetical protein MB02_01440 [Croceicoccus estronivorus]|uniref:DUF2254 domain-containing protein n=1 Tax=Croceicoccus estronivorus TaxID=1172626 RepID=UPI000830A10D|nr:DUF2254 domain-containing protein [Croceicoccus estronivorus]OCC25360.1 hypothetical protein MB02_01440 [Croceicoccus estronivorus]